MRVMRFHAPFPFLAFCLLAPFALTLPARLDHAQSPPGRGTIAREDSNLVSWLTAGVGGLSAASLGAHLTRNIPGGNGHLKAQRPQGELEMLLSRARRHSGHDANTAACVYRKSKLFFSDYDRIALEPETQMKLTIKWVADCRGEPVPEIAANAETEALEVLERENTESSATKADKGQAQKDQEDHFQSSSDMVGRLGVSQTINQFLSRAGGALRSVHGRGTPIMAQPYGMRRPMVTW